MGLFFKKVPPPDATRDQSFPLTSRKAWCQVCRKEQQFTKVWRRGAQMRGCPCCGMTFENPAALYKLVQPACPKCKEPLEQPGFDYGMCDGCGSKYELVEGAKPGLIPNLQQREEMEKHGKSRSVL